MSGLGPFACSWLLYVVGFTSRIMPRMRHDPKSEKKNKKSRQSSSSWDAFRSGSISREELGEVGFFGAMSDFLPNRNFNRVTSSRC